MPFGGLLTVGLIGAGGSIFGGLLGKSAADKASEAQVKQQQFAIAEQRRQFDVTQQKAQPFISAGQTSIGELMKGVGNGTFGTVQQAPQYNGAPFTAPTLEEAQKTPGYQFTAQQGNKGILAGAAATGGAISGGTLKALDTFNTGLADSTYNDVFARAFQTHQSGLADYQAKLAGYGAQLQGTQQAENELLAPAQIGAGSTANLATTGQQSAATIGGLMQGIGTAQAGGIVGGTNALTSGINNATNSATQALLLSKLLGPGGTGKGTPG